MIPLSEAFSGVCSSSEILAIFSPLFPYDFSNALGEEKRSSTVCSNIKEVMDHLLSSFWEFQSEEVEKDW